MQIIIVSIYRPVHVLGLADGVRTAVGDFRDNEPVGRGPVLE